MGATRELAAFAADLRHHAIPEAVRSNARLAILDSLGTALAGLDERSVVLVRDFATEGSQGPSTVIGRMATAGAGAAALANGAAAHALDFDSISLTVSGFVASPTLFAILAVAEMLAEPVPGERLVEAFVAGWETEAAIARGLGVLHYTKGWHATATLGHFGAAVGAARLLGLDGETMRHVIGIVAAEASGVRTMVGHMTNPFHVGKAARNGVTAALLAARGFTAHPDVLEAPSGFCVAFNGVGGFALDAMTEGLGTRWDITDPGLVVKLYPCCGLIHSAIDAALDLRAEHALDPERIAAITVAVHKLVPPTMSFDDPKSGYEAKFSTPFCMATAFTEGAVRLAHFSDERVRDPALRALMARVEMVVHPDLTEMATFLEREFSEVTVRLDDGRTFVRRVDRIANRGSRGRPATEAMIREKFLDCAGRTMALARAEAIFAGLAGIDRADDIRPLMELLR